MNLVQRDWCPEGAFEMINLNIGDRSVNASIGLEKTLDVMDLLILNYIHKLPIFCRPCTKLSNDNHLFTLKDNKIYSEISYTEFCVFYNDTVSGLISVDNFFDRVEFCVNCNLLDIIYCDEDNMHNVALFATTSIYNERCR